MEYNSITDENVESKDMMVVSINSIDSVYSYFKKQHSNVIIMHFGDYTEEDIKNKKSSTYVFNEYKAKKLYEFIKRNKDKSIAILHCAGGISRSYSIGLFIYDFFNDKKNNIIKHSSLCSLNYHIFKLLKEQYYLDHHIFYL
jgi:predicted protein tyrosine phosphatase